MPQHSRHVISQNGVCQLLRYLRPHLAGSVSYEEVSTIMRYLGAYPSEKAMTQEILPDMQARTVVAVDRAQPQGYGGDSDSP